MLSDNPVSITPKGEIVGQSRTVPGLKMQTANEYLVMERLRALVLTEAEGEQIIAAVRGRIRKS